MERREFMRGLGITAVGIGNNLGMAAQSLQRDHLTSAPAHAPSPSQSTAEILVQGLIDWGATHVFGLVGDGINPITEVLRKRQSEIAFITVRHEESAAWMASGMAKHSGRLGVCLATTGPGAIHLLNGLYDAALDGSPVVAITGMTFHDLEGVHFMQDVNTTKLMEDVAIYNEKINGPAHALFVVNRACRTALGNRGVAHLTIAKDQQSLHLDADPPSMENHGGRTSSSWSVPSGAPSRDQLQAAADLLNSCSRVAILAGQGCRLASGELEQIATKLAAPFAKAFLAKAVLPDDHPYTTGGIGHLGTAASSWTMQNCDGVLILGSTMPWINYYPKPGQARGVQIDIRADRIGIRYPIEVGLTGDMKHTLEALLPLLKQKTDLTFLKDARSHMAQWRNLQQQISSTQKSAKLRPQTILQLLSDKAPGNAMYSMDAGANTHFAARTIQIRSGQSFTGTGMLVSMASGLPIGIAGAFASPERMSIVVAGDGGLAMLMAEMSTAVLYKLNLKVLVLNNDRYAEVAFEQRELGNPTFGCDLSHIDFAAFAEAVGAKGFRAATLNELGPAMQHWLAADGPAILDVASDPEESPQEPEKETV